MRYDPSEKLEKFIGIKAILSTSKGLMIFSKIGYHSNY